MNIRLSDHFTYGRLLRFTFPSVIMLVFTSIYGVVDGFFVSNFAGKTPFAAVNFIMPLLMILGCAGFMFGTGGGALIAKTLGEGKREKANELFSLIVYTSIICGVVLAVFGFVCIRPVASLMGAEGRLLSDSVRYGWIVLLALPFYVLQFEFQCLFATAEKPKLGLYVTVASGVTNIVLDALFVAVFHWGMEGAAAATAFSQFVGGVVPLVYFGRNNGSLLRLVRLRGRPDTRALVRTCTNGSSELMSNISMSLVGVSAVLMFAAGQLLAGPLSYLFVGYDPGLTALTVRGFRFFSCSFLCSGFAIFGSSFFTALGDGLTSALISFLRTLVFESAAVLIFPILWGIDGIWMSIVAAEVLAAGVTFLFLAGKKKRYGY